MCARFWIKRKTQRVLSIPMQAYHHHRIYAEDSFTMQQPLQTIDVSSEDESWPTGAHSVATSIDDFLADYKHERVAILDFLSSLDDVSTSSLHNMQSRSSFIENQPIAFPIASAAVMSSQIASCVKITLPCKRTSESPSIELRDEQRRIKNREYQRRFRERRRKLQKQSAAASARQCQ
jgi:hypothetical protein